MHKPKQTISETTLGTPIQPLCPATMMAYIVSDGRLFGLKSSEWAMLLVGVVLCGLLTLLF
jgi:hypothetical protein